MIHKLTATAIFAKSGATLTAEHQPGSGITAVVGENGAGKTFLSIETTRWLLYGKAALRGAATDYRQADAYGEFSIRGARYSISRGKHEWLKDASGAMLAKGAEKVTEKVTELMGYGLDVFDLCNAATQGNVQQLGKLRPADRKAIIDKVARLTTAEAAEKACREEAKGYKREAETLALTLRAPGDEPPAVPTPSGEELAAGREARRALVRLESQLTMPFPPGQPVESRPAVVDIEMTERHVQEQRDLHARHRNLTVAAEGPSWSAAELDAADVRRAARAAREARGATPTLTLDEIEADWLLHHAADTHKASDEVTCPKCNHTFRPTGEAPTAPRYDKVYLREQQQRLARWEGADWNDPLPSGLDLTGPTITAARVTLEAREQLAALPPLGADKSGQLDNLRRRQAQWDAYEQAMVAYDDEVARNATVRAQIDALGYVPSQEDVDALSDALREAEAAHAARLAWEKDEAAFKETQAKVVEAQHLADEYAAGAKDVAAARAVVKALIAPKISRIATGLIRDMTMGKLTSLTLTEDMEILVGEQRIETLSGAGVTVANLALRIAMGRALVGHVFPVFLADEIDGDMTNSRREATLQSLVGLKDHLSQIILVTHRGAAVADHVWNVEST
jgi:DNA repair exonuclease SbcCD ATPase subunit